MSARQAAMPLVFLGCGNATRMHARTLSALGRRNMLYYASRDPERARDFARRLGGAGWFGSYEEALADPRPAVALIATPPSSHRDLALTALRHGKHVIVEKPPFTSTGELDEVRAVADTAGRRLMVAENYYYKPLAVAIRAAIRAGDIGEPQILSVNALKRQRVDGWRDELSLARGGAMFEGGIHWINFMANLGPAVIAAHGYRPGKRNGAERTMVSIFEYEGGAIGTLYYSWEIGSPLRGLRVSRIFGSRGTITFESNGLWLLVYGVRKRLALPGFRDISGFRAMFRDFLSVIETGGEPQMSLDCARRDLELIEQIYLTAGEEHQAVGSPAQ